MSYDLSERKGSGPKKENPSRTRPLPPNIIPFFQIPFNLSEMAPQTGVNTVYSPLETVNTALDWNVDKLN